MISLSADIGQAQKHTDQNRHGHREISTLGKARESFTSWPLTLVGGQCNSTQAHKLRTKKNCDNEAKERMNEKFADDVAIQDAMRRRQSVACRVRTSRRGAHDDKINLVVSHATQSRSIADPETGRYVLPWTRLHALKDYWGMVKILEEFPSVSTRVNVVPSLGLQLEEYPAGNFNEPWFDLAFKNAETTDTRGQKRNPLSAPFQVNHERSCPDGKVRRAVRMVAAGGRRASNRHFHARDWRTCQLLSQLAWMERKWDCARR